MDQRCLKTFVEKMHFIAHPTTDLEDFMPKKYQENINLYDACKEFARAYKAKELREPPPEEYFRAGALWMNTDPEFKKE